MALLTVRFTTSAETFCTKQLLDLITEMYKHDIRTPLVILDTRLFCHPYTFIILSSVCNVFHDNKLKSLTERKQFHRPLGAYFKNIIQLFKY